ncbi:MAG: prepilin-type N-terminal cleavage/methylation domain-containing protein [Parcubacteria group bacterium]
MHKSYQHGMSLIEVLLSITVFSMVILFFSAMYIYNLRSYNRAVSRTTAGEQSRNIVRQVSQSIREMQSSGTGAYPLAAAQTGTIIFFANVDTDTGIERVRYTVNGGKLEQGVIQPSGDPPTYPVATENVHTIATNIISDGQPYFTYYDQDFTGSQTQLPDPITLNQVRVVRTRMVLGTNRKDVSSEELSFYVQLRNLKDNY